MSNKTVIDELMANAYGYVEKINAFDDDDDDNNNNNNNNNIDISIPQLVVTLEVVTTI